MPLRGLARPCAAKPLSQAPHALSRTRARDAVVASWDEDLKDEELNDWFCAYYRHRHGLELGPHASSIVSLLQNGRR